MDRFFQSNPGLSSRIAHHIDFPDYGEIELAEIAERMLAGPRITGLDESAKVALGEYIRAGRSSRTSRTPARSGNALDRARLRQASRLFAIATPVTREALQTITVDDIRASRVFTMVTPPRTPRSDRIVGGPDGARMALPRVSCGETPRSGCVKMS